MPLVDYALEREVLFAGEEWVVAEESFCFVARLKVQLLIAHRVRHAKAGHTALPMTEQITHSSQS